MHKLRRAMVRPGRERLAGVVEVDETYWGAEEEGVSGRHKALIAVAAEERGRGLGRISARAERLGGQDALWSGRAGKRGAHRRLAGLRPLEKKGYQHRIEASLGIIARVHLAAVATSILCGLTGATDQATFPGGR